MHLARVEDVHSRLAAKGHTPPESQAWLDVPALNYSKPDAANRSE